jgi:1-phosphatidylinositol-4-phosphate 5-kinase
VDVYADHTASDVEGTGSIPPSPSYGSGAAHAGFSADRTLARIESNKPMEREGSEFFSKEDAASTQFQLRALDTPQGLAYLGIIDILTQYTHVKAQETFWCGYVAGCGADISCQPPSRYARRFLRMLDRVLVEPRGTDGDESSKGGSSVRGGVGRPVDLAKVKTSA